MNEARRLLQLSSLKAFDSFALIVSCGLTALLNVSQTGGASLVEALSVKVKIWNIVIVGALLILWHLIFVACGLYVSKRLATRWEESKDVAKGTVLATLSVIPVARVLRLQTFTSEFLVLFWGCSTAILVIGRLIGRYVLEQSRRRGRNLHHIIMLGTNSRAIDFAKKIESKPGLGYRIVGFVDGHWAGSNDFIRTGYRMCCDLEHLPEFLRENVVDEVAIFLPLRSFYENTSRVTALFEQHGIIMRFDSDLFNLKIARPHTDVFDGEPQITAHCGGSEGWSLLLKRIIDLTFSIVLLIFVFPLAIIIAILIKATSDGPVLFGQKRVGLGKRQFVMYKFRTMVPNAEEIQNELLHLNEMKGPAFKIRNDPRVTPIGRFLRKASLDELPQLFNVLKGDMSLVGPRAMSVRDYQLFSEDWQRRRFSVRPGITCLWQVNGRNSIPFEQWMELDMQYIDKWSIWLDLKILARTIPAVLRGSGAA